MTIRHNILSAVALSGIIFASHAGVSHAGEANKTQTFKPLQALGINAGQKPASATSSAMPRLATSSSLSLTNPIRMIRRASQSPVTRPRCPLAESHATPAKLAPPSSSAAKRTPQP